jgi:hypothetical protein
MLLALSLAAELLYCRRCFCDVTEALRRDGGLPLRFRPADDGCDGRWLRRPIAATTGGAVGRELRRLTADG